MSPSSHAWTSTRADFLSSSTPRIYSLLCSKNDHLKTQIWPCHYLKPRMFRYTQKSSMVLEASMGVLPAHLWSYILLQMLLILHAPDMLVFSIAWRWHRPSRVCACAASSVWKSHPHLYTTCNCFSSLTSQLELHLLTPPDDDRSLWYTHTLLF